MQRGSLTYSSLHSQKVEQPQQTGFSVDVLSSSWCCSASLRWHLYILAVSWDIMLASFLKPSQNTGTSSPPACSIQDGAWEALSQIQPASHLPCKPCNSVLVPCWMKRMRSFHKGLWSSSRTPGQLALMTLFLPVPTLDVYIWTHPQRGKTDIRVGSLFIPMFVFSLFHTCLGVQWYDVCLLHFSISKRHPLSMIFITLPLFKKYFLFLKIVVEHLTWSLLS